MSLADGFGGEEEARVLLQLRRRVPVGVAVHVVRVLRHVAAAAATRAAATDRATSTAAGRCSSGCSGRRRRRRRPRRPPARLVVAPVRSAAPLARACLLASSGIQRCRLRLPLRPLAPAVQFHARALDTTGWCTALADCPRTLLARV